MSPVRVRYPARRDPRKTAAPPFFARYRADVTDLSPRHVASTIFRTRIRHGSRRAGGFPRRAAHDGRPPRAPVGDLRRRNGFVRQGDPRRPQEDEASARPDPSRAGPYRARVYREENAVLRDTAKSLAGFATPWSSSRPFKTSARPMTTCSMKSPSSNPKPGSLVGMKSGAGRA